jgi:hypothetical protein
VARNTEPAVGRENSNGFGTRMGESENRSR